LILQGCFRVIAWHKNCFYNQINNTGTLKRIKREEPCGRERRASEIEYLFPVSFPLVGNSSDCSRSQERFWTSQNDRNKELRQRPQGVKFMKSLNIAWVFTILTMIGTFSAIQRKW